MFYLFDCQTICPPHIFVIKYSHSLGMGTLILLVTFVSLCFTISRILIQFVYIMFTNWEKQSYLIFDFQL